MLKFFLYPIYLKLYYFIKNDVNIPINLVHRKMATQSFFMVDLLLHTKFCLSLNCTLLGGIPSDHFRGCRVVHWIDVEWFNVTLLLLDLYWFLFSLVILVHMALFLFFEIVFLNSQKERLLDQIGKPLICSAFFPKSLENCFSNKITSLSSFMELVS